METIKITINLNNTDSSIFTKMPVVKIDMWSGRNEEQKGVIIKKVTEAIVESCGCPKEAVTVVIDDIPKENWGSGGEQHSKKFKDM